MTHVATPATTASGGGVALRRVLATNIGARLGALVSLGVATVIIARVGGPDLVGGFTLLRVLPGIVGVLAVAGLPGAAPYFLSRQGTDRALRPTIVLLTVSGATVGLCAWLALTPVLHRVFFDSWSQGLTLMCGGAVFTQLLVAVGKALLQSGDLAGANVAIIAEEAVFLPVYLALIPSGHGLGPVLLALVLTDIVVAIAIGARLRRNGFFRDWARPRAALAWEISAYGVRGQLGGLMSLVNLRLDVAILGAMSGPGVLGVYAIASKYAELLRLPGLAVTYVLYPVFSRDGRQLATRRTRALIPRAFWLTVASAIPLALAAPLALPLLYGESFDTAIHPTWILLFGLLGEGVSGLITAYLYGIGRPGLNSLSVAVGVVVTVVGDLTLIPHLAAVGASIASAAAYFATTLTLIICFHRLKRSGHEVES